MDIIISDVHDHEGQEGDQEAEEDGEHHPGETHVLLAGEGRRGRGHRAAVVGVSSYVTPRLLHLVINGRVAGDNSNHGKQETKEEQELLGRGPVSLEDGAGEGWGVEAQLSPDPEERWDHHAEGEEPDEGDHEVYEVLAVHSVIEAVVCDENVPVHSDGHHVEKRRGHIPVEEEWEHTAEGVAEHPGLVDVPGGGERQVNGAEEKVRYAEADDEGGGGVESQLPIPAKGDDRDEVTQDSDDYEEDAGTGGKDCGGPRVVDEACDIPLGATAVLHARSGVVDGGRLLDESSRLGFHCHCTPGPGPNTQAPHTTLCSSSDNVSVMTHEVLKSLENLQQLTFQLFPLSAGNTGQGSVMDVTSHTSTLGKFSELTTTQML